MLAILGALLEDNDNDDDDSRPSKINFSVPGEYIDTEITRVGVYAIVSTQSQFFRAVSQSILRSWI